MPVTAIRAATSAAGTARLLRCRCRKLHAEHGDFVLVNTNFTDVNPYLPALGLSCVENAARPPQWTGGQGHAASVR